MDGAIFVANAENIALEKLRVFARDMARMATDLTTLTYSVPVDHVAIHTRVKAMEVAARGAEITSL